MSFFYTTRECISNPPAASNTGWPPVPETPVPEEPVPPGDFVLTGSAACTDYEADPQEAAAELSWTVPEGDGTITYRVDRDTGSGYVTLEDDLATTSYIDYTLPEGIEATYRITATSEFGESDSNTLALTGDCNIPPGAPTLTGSANCTDNLAVPMEAEALLDWDAVAGDGTITYDVERQIGIAPWDVIAVGLLTTDYTDETMPGEGANVSYRIRAESEYGFEYSNTLILNTPCTEPSLEEYVPGRIIYLMDMPQVIGSMIVFPPVTVPYMGPAGSATPVTSNAGTTRPLYSTNPIDYDAGEIYGDTNAQNNARWETDDVALDATFQPCTLGMTLIDVQLLGYQDSPTSGINAQLSVENALSLEMRNSPFENNPFSSRAGYYFMIGRDGAGRLDHQVDIRYLGSGENLRITGDEPNSMWQDDNSVPASNVTNKSLTAIIYRIPPGSVPGVDTADLFHMNESARVLYSDSGAAIGDPSLSGEVLPPTALRAYISSHQHSGFASGTRHGGAHPVLLIMEGAMTDQEIEDFCNAVFDGVRISTI